MADNRLCLRCSVCGEEVAIARLSAGAEEWAPSRTPPEEFAQFLVTHRQCSPDEALRVWLSDEDGRGIVIGSGWLPMDSAPRFYSVLVWDGRECHVAWRGSDDLWTREDMKVVRAELWQSLPTSPFTAEFK